MNNLKNSIWQVLNSRPQSTQYTFNAILNGLPLATHPEGVLKTLQELVAEGRVRLTRSSLSNICFAPVRQEVEPCPAPEIDLSDLVEALLDEVEDPWIESPECCESCSKPANTVEPISRSAIDFELEVLVRDRLSSLHELMSPRLSNPLEHELCSHLNAISLLLAGTLR